MIRLRTATWSLKFRDTTTTIEDGRDVDIYWLLDDREVDPDTKDIVSLVVPAGRSDIAEFVARSVLAGQRVIQGLPLGSPMIKDEQPGFGEEEN